MTAPKQAAGGWTVPARPYHSPGELTVEGDWSNAAPWLCMGALAGHGVTVTGLDSGSLQGDRAICAVLARMGALVARDGDRVTARHGPAEPAVNDARNIPDLVPVLAAAASVLPGQTEITGAAPSAMYSLPKLMWLIFYIIHKDIT